MSEHHVHQTINLSSWVEKAHADPVKYHIRQMIEILMHAIGTTKHLKGNMYLKGGTLMALAHESERMTGDVDYSWFGEPFSPDIAEEISQSLGDALKRAAVRLGYLDMLCHIQSVKKQPRRWEGKVSYPALDISIGYAKKGSPQEKALQNGNASQVLLVEISFNESVNDTQQLLLDDSEVSVNAYAPTEIVAEKMRALLQQIQRSQPRYRRQDIYDIALLLKRFSFNEEEKHKILKTLRMKSDSREVIIYPHSLSDKAVRDAAEKEWKTMALELEKPLPDFSTCYDEVQRFYESLPW